MQSRGCQHGMYPKYVSVYNGQAVEDFRVSFSSYPNNDINETFTKLCSIHY